jgi:hypothetical protein
MTDLRAGLKPGHRYELLDCRSSGEKLVMEACAAIAGDASIPDTMMIIVGMGHSICSESLLTSKTLISAPPSCQPSELTSAAPVVTIGRSAV